MKLNSDREKKIFRAGVETGARNQKIVCGCVVGKKPTKKSVKQNKVKIQEVKEPFIKDKVSNRGTLKGKKF